MANTGGFVKESIWRDKDFRALPRTAQATYAQLISQKELDRAGMLPFQPTKWVKGCDAMTMEDLYADLKTLETTRFIFVDVETDEVFVRSYMRQSNVVSQPNLLKNAVKCAGMVDSEYLRHELAIELRRLSRAEATRTADEIDPGEGFEMPSETLPEHEPITNPARRVSEPHHNPSGTLPEPLNPSGTLPEPTGPKPGVGEGVTLVDGDLGGSRARARTREASQTEPPTPSNGPPPATCPRHPHGTDDPCHACRRARQTRTDWDTTHADRERQAVRSRAEAEHAAAVARATTIRAERDACSLCDTDGYQLDPDGQRVGVCRHNPDQADVNERGRAKLAEVRARMAAERKSLDPDPAADDEADPEPEDDS